MEDGAGVDTDATASFGSSETLAGSGVPSLVALGGVNPRPCSDFENGHKEIFRCPMTAREGGSDRVGLEGALEKRDWAFFWDICSSSVEALCD